MEFHSWYCESHMSVRTSFLHGFVNFGNRDFILLCIQSDTENDHHCNENLFHTLAF